MLALVKYLYKTNDTRSLSQISFGPLIGEKIHTIFTDQNALIFKQFAKQLENETKAFGILVHNEFAEVRESEMKSLLNELKQANFATFEKEARNSL